MPFLRCTYRHEPKEIADPVQQVAATPGEITPLLLTSFVDDSNAIAVRHSTDSYLLLHQADLENLLGPTALRKYVDSVRTASFTSDPIQQSLDRLSDQQLFSVVRNRHIQQPSDIQDSLEGIVRDADSFLAALQVEQDLRRQESTPEPPAPVVE